MNLEQFGPIKEEDKVTAEEKLKEEGVELEELQPGWSYRIVNFSVKPEKVMLGGTVTVSGKVEAKAWWPWASWNGVSNPVQLFLGGVSQGCMTSGKDGSFEFNVKIPKGWEVGDTAAVQVKAIRYGRYGRVVYPPPKTNPGEEIKCPGPFGIDPDYVASTKPVTIQVVSGPPGENPPEEGSKKGSTKAKPFMEYLKNLQLEKMWKYYREETIALGFGVFTLLMMIGSD